jgi:hypothetical protein
MHLLPPLLSHSSCHMHTLSDSHTHRSCCCTVSFIDLHSVTFAVTGPAGWLLHYCSDACTCSSWLITALQWCLHMVQLHDYCFKAIMHTHGPAGWSLLIAVMHARGPAGWLLQRCTHTVLLADHCIVAVMQHIVQLGEQCIILVMLIPLPQS